MRAHQRSYIGLRPSAKTALSLPTHALSSTILVWHLYSLYFYAQSSYLLSDSRYSRRLMFYQWSKISRLLVISRGHKKQSRPILNLSIFRLTSRSSRYASALPSYLPYASFPLPIVGSAKLNLWNLAPHKTQVAWGSSLSLSRLHHA